MPKPNLITVTQAAERCDLTAASIRRACSRGSLPAVKLGKTWLIAPTDLQKWLADDSQHKPGAKGERQ